MYWRLVKIRRRRNDSGNLKKIKSRFGSEDSLPKLDLDEDRDRDRDEIHINIKNQR